MMFIKVLFKLLLTKEVFLPIVVYTVLIGSIIFFPGEFLAMSVLSICLGMGPLIILLMDYK